MKPSLSVWNFLARPSGPRQMCLRPPLEKTPGVSPRAVVSQNGQTVRQGRVLGSRHELRDENGPAKHAQLCKPQVELLGLAIAMNRHHVAQPQQHPQENGCRICAIHALGEGPDAARQRLLRPGATRPTECVDEEPQRGRLLVVVQQPMRRHALPSVDLHQAWQDPIFTVRHRCFVVDVPDCDPGVRSKARDNLHNVALQPSQKGVRRALHPSTVVHVRQHLRAFNVRAPDRIKENQHSNHAMAVHHVQKSINFFQESRALPKVQLLMQKNAHGCEADGARNTQLAVCSQKGGFESF
mmetsp:Transcript_147834/g.474558  ORF Transcript_147834/g.474558 Transcript_147834/m.474558 type:complete len:297 (+) Transcript_147834:496-1386(+)